MSPCEVDPDPTVLCVRPTHRGRGPLMLTPPGLRLSVVVVVVCGVRMATREHLRTYILPSGWTWQMASLPTNLAAFSNGLHTMVTEAAWSVSNGGASRACPYDVEGKRGRSRTADAFELQRPASIQTPAPPSPAVACH